jgi:hypothetical protein
MVSVQSQPWPEPAAEIAAAIKAMYGGKREKPLAVQVRDRLGELFPDAELGAALWRGVVDQAARASWSW